MNIINLLRPNGVPILTVFKYLAVATVSFSSPTYTVSENAGTLKVTITRSGAVNTTAVVQVASDAFEGTASG